MPTTSLYVENPGRRSGENLGEGRRNLGLGGSCGPSHEVAVLPIYLRVRFQAPFGHFLDIKLPAFGNTVVAPVVHGLATTTYGLGPGGDCPKKPYKVVECHYAIL
jgi:hypothetical protein